MKSVNGLKEVLKTEESTLVIKNFILSNIFCISFNAISYNKENTLILSPFSCQIIFLGHSNLLNITRLFSTT